MTRLRLEPNAFLSQLLLKQNGRVMTVKMENLNEIKSIPIKLNLISGGLGNGTKITKPNQTK